jgi:hypothetical protein
MAIDEGLQMAYVRFNNADTSPKGLVKISGNFFQNSIWPAMLPL